MNKSWFYLGVIASLAIFITSCGGEAQPPTPPATPAATAPTSATPPVAATPATPATPAAPGAVPAATPAVPGKSVAVKSVSVDVAAGLIPPTDGESWAKTVAKGRPDPFGMLSLQTVEVIEPIDPLTQPVTAKVATTNSLPTKSGAIKLAPLPTVKVATAPAKTAKVSSKQRIASNGNKAATAGVSTQPGSVSISAIPRTGINRALPKIVVAIPPSKTAKAATTASVPNKKGTAITATIPTNKKGAAIIAKSANNKGTLAIKPAKVAITTKSRANNSAPAIQPVQTPSVITFKPEKIAEKPVQAMAIEISGVIEVGGQTQVIIKMPTEAFSRYIEVGEKFGNGKILVKRIEGQNSLSPTVVLEEVGVEVPRKIGDKSPAPVESVAPPAQKTP